MTRGRDTSHPSIFIEKESLPPDFIDAVLAYTIDPTQWEQVAKVLRSHDQALLDIDPNAFLSFLSQAEALAWHLHQSPANDIRHNTNYVALDVDANALKRCSFVYDLADYCADDGEFLAFHDKDTHTNIGAAVAELHSGKSHALVELNDGKGGIRFGYLVAQAALPPGVAPAFQAPAVDSVMLVSQAETSNQTRMVMQSSFGLTSAESEVCARLATGLSLKEVAGDLGISNNTARNHLQSVFDKTSLNRQNDLILMMTQLNVILTNLSSPDTQDAPTQAVPYPGHQFCIAASKPPRRVAYRVYGSGSHTVLYFHESCATSRLLPGTDDLATDLGLRIIVMERPGFGFSDPLAQLSFEDIAADGEHLLNELQCERVSLMGNMAGGAYAATLAARMTNRANHLMLIAGRAPNQYDDAPNELIYTLRHKLAQQPWLINTFFNILRNRANKATVTGLLKRVYGSTEKDRAFLEEHKEIVRHMRDAALESLTVSAAGVVAEIGCFTQPSSVDLSPITCGITYWYGDQDTLVSPEQSLRAFASHDVDVRVFEGWGSLLMYAKWEAALTHLARQVSSPSD